MKYDPLKTPEIKSWDCSDHDPIEDWVPDDPSDVEFWFNISIGIKNEVGADNFQVHVATNKAVASVADKRKLVIIPYYEGWEQILAVLQPMVEQCTDISWSGMSNQLSKMFFWEYEGMS